MSAAHRRDRSRRAARTQGSPIKYLNAVTQPGCYVYLFRFDGVAAYAGKGSKYRLRFHERAALHHRRKTRFQSVLAGAIRRGVRITVEVLAEALTNDEANACEVSVITKLGRRDLGTGTLFNRTAGGDGLTREDAIRVFSNPKTRRKLVRASRRNGRDPLYRARLALAQRRGWADPNQRPKRLAILRANIAKPGVRAKMVSSCAVTNRRPDVHARRSAAAKALHQDPEYRQKLCTALRRAANRPKRKAQVRQQMIERNKDPEFNRRRLEGIQRHWQQARAMAGKA